MNNTSRPRAIRLLDRIWAGFQHRPAGDLDLERAEQTFYIKYLKEAMVAFDVGANVGELTLLFSRFVEQHGQVHAFEASSRTFARLKTVCESVNRKKIMLYPVALAQKEGTVALHPGFPISN